MASEALGSKAFSAYVATLQLSRTHAGMQGLHFVRIVPDAQKAQFIAEMRRQGDLDYTITQDEQQPVSAPVTYRVALAGTNLPALGVDLYSNPMHRTALEYALEHRVIAITDKVALSTKGVSVPGFTMYAPVYRKSSAQQGEQAIGWIGALVRVDDLMAPLSAEERLELDVEIYDGEEIAGPKLMYDGDNWPMRADAAAGRYRSINQLQVANHVWTVAVRSLPPFEARLDRSVSLLEDTCRSRAPCIWCIRATGSRRRK